ncbi:hypothetical protein MHYP_G00275170, partial [Metynnis hypsauchen]
ALPVQARLWLLDALQRDQSELPADLQHGLLSTPQAVTQDPPCPGRSSPSV